MKIIAMHFSSIWQGLGDALEVMAPLWRLSAGTTVAAGPDAITGNFHTPLMCQSGVAVVTADACLTAAGMESVLG